MATKGSRPEPLPEPAGRAESPPCANCGTPVQGRYCGRCGQEQKTLRVAFHRIVGEGVAETLSFDSRVARTLGALLFRPGAATQAYLAGKRASQTSPVKLYLLLSFLFFLAGAVRPSSLEVRPAPAGLADAAPVQLSEEDLRELRGSGGLGAPLADRLERLAKLPPEVVRERLAAGFGENAPKAMFFLVPVLALLLWIFFLRSGFFFAEHVIFALHAHAVAFLFLAASELAGGRHTALAIFAAGLHAAAAMHRVYGLGWGGTLLRAFAVSFTYVIALGVLLVAVVVATLLTV